MFFSSVHNLLANASSQKLSLKRFLTIFLVWSTKMEQGGIFHRTTARALTTYHWPNAIIFVREHSGTMINPYIVLNDYTAPRFWCVFMFEWFYLPIANKWVGWNSVKIMSSINRVLSLVLKSNSYHYQSHPSSNRSSFRQDRNVFPCWSSGFLFQWHRVYWSVIF